MNKLEQEAEKLYLVDTENKPLIPFKEQDKSVRDFYLKCVEENQPMQYWLRGRPGRKETWFMTPYCRSNTTGDSKGVGGMDRKIKWCPHHGYPEPCAKCRGMTGEEWDKFCISLAKAVEPKPDQRSGGIKDGD